MNTRGWLIYKKEDAQRNQSFIDWFIHECDKQNINLQLVERENLTIGVIQNMPVMYCNHQTCKKPDFAVVRTIDSLLSHQLEIMGVSVFNSSEVSELCNDKARTHQRLAIKGIPMIDTVFLHKDDLTKEMIPFDYPLIVKGSNGRGGTEVFKVTNENELAALTFPSEHCIVQKVAEQQGKDLRVFIVGNKIVGAVLRESSTQFKANYTLGGTASFYHLSVKEKELIYKIIDGFSFGMVGIDFLFDKNGDLLLNEIEDIVGSRTLSATSSINILEHYVSYIRQQLK